jgi:hypothetical protein
MMGRRVSNPAFGRLTLANACFFLPSDIHHYYIVTTTRDTSIYVPRAHKSSTAFEHCMNVASVYNDCFALHRSLSRYRWMLAVSPARSVARHVGRDVIRDLPFTCIYAYEERESYIKLRRLARGHHRVDDVRGAAFNETSKHTTHGTFRIRTGCKKSPASIIKIRREYIFCFSYLQVKST